MSYAAALVGALALLYVSRSHRQAPMLEAGVAASTHAAQGGLVNIDSARAVRHAILRRIQESRTYLGAMLTDMDSTLKRWPDRHGQPVSVYLPAGLVDGYQLSFESQVRRAFIEWSTVPNVPLHFIFVRDSSAALVHVRWIERFPSARTGQADVVWNQNGWLQRGVLTLATHTPKGWPLDADAVYTVALHEIGHLIGLGHSDDPNDVMSATTSVHDLTPRDRHSATLLYALPPGSVAEPVARH